MNTNKGLSSLIRAISLLFVVTFACSLALYLEPTSVAHAATFTIADGDVYGPNGLIAAINTANGNGQANSINLAQNGLYTLTTVNNTDSDGDNGLPQINSAITINGNGAVIERSSANNTPGFRLFNTGSNAAFKLDSLTIRNSKLAGSTSSTTGGDGNGGALYNNGGHLSISNTIFSNNSALGGDVISTGSNSSNFGGIGAGGAIYNKGGTVTVTESFFSANLAKGGNTSTTNNWAYGGLGRGGAIFSTNGALTLNNVAFLNNSANGGSGSSSNAYNAGTGGAGGGFFSMNDTLTIVDSTFSNNSVTGGDGSDNNGEGFGGGLESYHSNTTIAGSTFSGNKSAAGTLRRTQVVGSSGAYGGGIDSFGGTLILANSTISNNSVVGGNALDGPPGPGEGGGLYNDSNASVYNTTFSTNSALDGTGTGNSSSVGGGIYNRNVAQYPGYLNLSNTIIANNSNGGNCAGTAVVNITHNLDSGSSCGFSNNGSISNQDPQLLPLGDNGGPTQTMALAAGSSAIDAGDNIVCAAAPINNVDQRNTSRLVGASCDIGAFEAGPNPCTVLQVNTNQDTNVCGTLRYAVNYLNANPASFNKTINITLAITPATITVSGSGFNIPAGIMINGVCNSTTKKPDITLDGTGIAGDGLTLNGGDTVTGLKIKGFGRKQIKANRTVATKNQLTCIVVSKT